MQNINVYNSDALTNANNIKDAFDNNVTGYFSRIEVDSTTDSENSVYVNFYIQGMNEPAMQWRIFNSANLDNYHTLRIGSSTVNCSQGSSDGYRFQRIVVCDNAIAVKCTSDGYTYSQRYFIICKSETGGVIVFYLWDSNAIKGVSSEQTGSYYYGVSSLTHQTHTYYYLYRQNNRDNMIIGYPAAHMTDGASQNAYIAVNVCYGAIYEPFTYTINGESYVGVCFNNFIIKSE